MATITKTWDVHSLETFDKDKKNKQVVRTVHWILTGVSGTTTVTRYGSVYLTADDNTVLTPYTDLTKDQVIEWVKEALGEEQISEMDASIDAEIKNKLQNHEIPNTLVPWNKELPTDNTDINT